MGWRLAVLVHDARADRDQPLELGRRVAFGEHRDLAAVRSDRGREAVGDGLLRAVLLLQPAEVDAVAGGAQAVELLPASAGTAWPRPW